MRRVVRCALLLWRSLVGPHVIDLHLHWKDGVVYRAFEVANHGKVEDQELRRVNRPWVPADAGLGVGKAKCTVPSMPKRTSVAFQCIWS